MMLVIVEFQKFFKQTPCPWVTFCIVVYNTQETVLTVICNLTFDVIRRMIQILS